MIKRVPNKPPREINNAAAGAEVRSTTSSTSSSSVEDETVSSATGTSTIGETGGG